MMSPFLHGNPVPPDQLVGRRRPLANIVNRLANRGQSCAILGEPRTGKTSLLDYLTSRSAHRALQAGDCARVIVSYLDSHALDHGLRDTDFWEHVFSPLDTPDNTLSPDDPVHEALRAWRATGCQTRRIPQLLAAFHASGVRLVLLIDELDYLVQHCVSKPRTFFGALRSAATTSRGALALVVATRRPLAVLDEIAQGAGYSGSPYFNYMPEEPLGPLAPDEVDTILSRAGGRFSSEDEALVRSLAAGQPYLVQLAADALWRAHEDGAVDIAARHAGATERALREASRVLADMWRQWSAPQRYVLASTAVRHPIVAVRFREAIDALLAQGFLRKDGSEIRIGPGLLQSWILGEILTATHAEDPWRAWIGPEDRPIPLQATDKRAWIEAVRAAVTSGDVPPGSPPPARSSERRRAKLFIAYSQHDDRHRERLEGHLSALRQEDLVEIWHDQHILPGDDRRAGLGTMLQTADIVLMLVSPDFLASDFCIDSGLARAIERHRAGTARVIPIAVRSADWGELPFASLQALPRNRQPVALFRDQDEAWAEVAQEIRRVVAARDPPSGPKR